MSAIEPAGEPQLQGDSLRTLDLLIAGMSYMAPGFSLFFTTAVIAGEVGIYIPLAYLLAGLGVLATGAALAEFSRLAPSAGSLQTFLRRGFGRVASVTGGLVLMTGYLCLQSGVAALFGGWSAELLEDVGVSVPWQLLTVAGVLLCLWLMLRGVQISIRATWVLFLIEFFILIAIGVAVLAAGGADGLSTAPIDFSFDGVAIGGLALGMVFATFSFVGFEGSIAFAEETSDPRKALPVAVLGAVAIIVTLYVFVTYATVVGFGVGGIDGLVGDAEPIASLAALYAGPLEPLLKIAVLSSLAANLMAAGNANSRILFNLGREHAVRHELGRVHPTHRTPHVALTAFMLATLVPSLLASIAWGYLAVFANIAGLGSLLALLIYMTATLALPAYIRREGRPLRPLAHVALPLAGTVIWLIALWGTVKPGQPFPFNTYPYIAAALIAGFAVYAARRRTRSPAPLASEPARAGTIA